MGSRRVAQLGAAIVVMKNNLTGGKDGKPLKDKDGKTIPDTDYLALIRQLLKEEKFRAGARAFAKKYEKFNQAGQSRAIASRVEELLQS